MKLRSGLHSAQPGAFTKGFGTWWGCLSPSPSRAFHPLSLKLCAGTHGTGTGWGLHPDFSKRAQFGVRKQHGGSSLCATAWGCSPSTRNLPEKFSFRSNFDMDGIKAFKSCKKKKKSHLHDITSIKWPSYITPGLWAWSIGKLHNLAWRITRRLFQACWDVRCESLPQTMALTIERVCVF